MSINHAIWRVGDNPQPLTTSKLASEQLLEKMILNVPAILSDQWIIENTSKLEVALRQPLVELSIQLKQSGLITRG
ncbi:Uncharacterised protein [Providencia rettgeri]|uniref:Uncharacterized protein n=1 Tax=Providencia rettgeri TaxID=587 RepID=A0A9N8H231_PRORE|nr:hypothetical protein DNK63_01320 [Providencia rettgeri]QIF67545.1 hypothetical protein FVA72_19380 [Providencia sp. 1709051003]CAB5648505.1 Uncharacterised protein [Providencia rettgeri]CAB5705574.1 Uncharacterised protein [Providencia rettgeri]CAC9211922.1 Uncharacterised protein [Providencia rettgeri]